MAETEETKAEAIPGNAKWWMLLGISCGVLMFTLDMSIVNVTIPTLATAFHATFSAVQWVVVSYLLVITVLMLGAARLGDMIGKKKLFLAGISAFTLASLLCGCAWSLPALIGFRALQGLGGVCMSAMGPALLTEVFPASERGRALGTIGSVVSIGLVTGPSIGGLLLSAGGWRTVFLVNVPLGVLAAIIVAKLMPLQHYARPPQRFDYLGSILIGGSMGCFAFGMNAGQRTGFDNHRALAMLGLSALFMALFLFSQTRVTQPMLDLRLFRNVQFSLGLALGFLVFVVLAGSFFILPFFLELVKHYPPWQVGLMLGISPVMTGIISPVSGALSDRVGTRPISLAGLCLMGVACFLIGGFSQNVSVVMFACGVAPLGLGMGIFQSPNTSEIMGNVPREDLGIASGLFALGRTLGQTTGVPLLGSIFAYLVHSAPSMSPDKPVTTAPVAALMSGFQTTYRIGGGIIFGAAVLAAVAWYLKRRTPAIISGSP